MTADRFRIAAESAKVGVFDHDHATDAVYWSPVFRQMLAFSARTRAALSKYMDRIHPDDRPAVTHAIALAHAPEQDGTLEEEHRLRLPDGRIRWIHLRARIFFAGRGRHRRPVRTVGVVVDITTRKEMELTLRDSERHYHRLFDQAYEFLGLLSLDGILLDANATALAFAGTSRFQVVGRYFWDTPWWSGSASARRRLKRAITQAAEGQFVRFDTQHRNAKGESESVDFSLRPMLDEDGKVFCLIPEGRLVRRGESDVDSATNTTASKEELMQTILDHSMEGIVIFDEHGTIASFNRAAENIFGYAAAEVRGRDVRLLIPPPASGYKAASVRRLMSTDTLLFTGGEREVQGRRRNGSPFAMRLSVGEVKVGRRHRVFTGMIQDLTSHKQVEQAMRDAQGALRESNRMAEEVINSVNEGIAVYDRDLICVLRNRFMVELSGIPNEEVVGHQLMQRFPELQAHGIDQAMQQALAGETVMIDHPLGRVRGTSHFLPPGSEDLPNDNPDVVWTWPTYHPRRSSAGDVIGVILVVSDGSARKRAQDEINAQHARVRALIQELERAREEERQRLSRELHDEMAQLLTALRIDASWLHRKLAPEHASLAQRALSMVDLIDRIKQSTRRIAGQLRPRALDEEGLIRALRNLCEEFSDRLGTMCEFFSPIEEPQLSDATVTLLYRATQEALTNVARHADCTRVVVHLEVDRHAVMLEIRDNGKGMLPDDQKKPTSFGLLGMRERVAGAGGTLRVESTPGVGTTLRIRVPISTSS